MLTFKKTLKHILVFIISLIIVIQTFNFLFLNNNNYTYMMMNEMYSQDKNIDILFLGSSHTYRSIIPEVIDNSLNKNSFNAGSSSQLMDQSYYLLKEIISINDVEIVFLDTYFEILNTDTSKNDKSVFYISDYIKNPINKIEYLYSSGGFESVLNGLFSARHNISLNYNIVKNIKSHNICIGDYSNISYDSEKYSGKGFVYSYKEYNGELNENNLDQYNVSDFSMKYLLKIIKLCEDNGIKLVLIDAPMPKEIVETSCYGKYAKIISNLAKENGAYYFNRNLNNVPYDYSYFMDANHLNGKGATRYTKEICEFYRNNIMTN